MFCNGAIGLKSVLSGFQNDLTLFSSENFVEVEVGGGQSSSNLGTTEIILLGPILTRGVWGMEIWSISGHLKKKLGL